MSSAATMSDSWSRRSAMRRLILAGATMGEVMSSPSIPPAASASASPSVAQQMPSAPASSWRRAICTLLWVFAWGRTATPCSAA